MKIVKTDKTVRTGKLGRRLLSLVLGAVLSLGLAQTGLAAGLSQAKLTRDPEGILLQDGKRLVMQVVNPSATIYGNAKKSTYLSTARAGAVDYVTEVTTKTYGLLSGGWIDRETAKLVSSKTKVVNKVSKSGGVVFDEERGGESYTFTGTSNPMFRAKQTSKSLTLVLYNTTGIDDSKNLVKGSRLFSGLTVEEEDGNTTLHFKLKSKAQLWGYDVGYSKGKTTLYMKYPPEPSGGKKPLTGVTIMLDPGHGGKDTGAISHAGTSGAVESEINLAVGLTLQKRLKNLGATVLMTRTKNEQNPTLNERLDRMTEERADFFLALHCNSVGYNSAKSTMSGVEIYYYEDIAEELANSLSQNIADATGRTNRGARVSNYRVTLNPFAPSVLVELGYMSQRAEYADLISKEGISAACEGISNALLEVLDLD